MRKSDSIIYQLITKFSAPLASVILMIFGSAVYTTFISLFLNEHGHSRNAIGMVQSAFFMGMFIGAFKMESLIRRIGHIQALAVFGSIATCSTLLQGLMQTFPAWMLLRFFFGLSIASLYIVIESWMLSHSNAKTRGVILSLYMIALYLSQSLSQQVLSYIDIKSFTPFLLSAIFTSLSVIPVGLCKDRITLPETHTAINMKEIIRRSPFGVTGCFVAGLILSSLFSFFPLFASSRDILSQNLMSITIGGGVILQWPIGKLSDFFERRKTLIFVILITLMLSILSFLYKGLNATYILSLIFLFGGFSFTLYPLSLTQVCDHLDHSQITAATAYLLIAYGFGCVIGPITSSMVIQVININWLFLYFAALLGLLALQGMYMSLKKPIIPLDEQTNFSPMPNTTPIAMEMDPRAEVAKNEEK